MRSKGEGDAATAAERMDAATWTAGALAHEFANILGTVRTMTSLMKEEIAEKSPAAEDLDIVIAAVDAGERLLHDLRAFVHARGLGEGAAELGEVARAVAAACGREGAVAVEAPDRPVPVRAAPDQLEASLSRLVRVLLEEVPAGAAVRIQVLPDQDETARGWLAVDCQGLELETGLAARLFEPFVLGKGHHTGLALPAVHAAVTKAGGVVSADIVPGAGLTIRLGLPLAPRDAADPEASSR